MLALAGGAQWSVSILLIAPALLIHDWHRQLHWSLLQGGVVAMAPSLGMVVALYPWGAWADRLGERRVLVAGLSLSAVVAVLAVINHGFWWWLVIFFAAGLTSASANAASGRVVVGWFPRAQRGLAMGIRQVAQPVGVFVGAATIPALAQRYGSQWSLLVPVGAIVLVTFAVAWGLQDPPRPPLAEGRAALNPYRRSSFLWRIHGLSALLVIPQYALSTFGVEWLTDERHWSIAAAGVLVGVSQLVGSAGRIGIGAISDRLTSRVAALRGIALSSAVAMVALALGTHERWSPVALIYVIATAISVADNGIAFTAVAEVAGPTWAGRALGAQNSGQFLAAAAVGPSAGFLIAAAGYPWTFAIGGLCALAAVPLVPRRDGHGDEEPPN
jgi:MFS family permease